MRNEKKFSDKQKSQIKHWKKKIKNVNLYRKIEVLYFATLGYTNEQICELTGYSIRRISSLINEYLKNGIKYFLAEHRKGGNRRKVTIEEEKALLERFRLAAEKGRVIDLSKMKKAYEEIRGEEVENSTFYAFLKRYKWRRVMPRGQHPKKASDEDIEASKKLTKFSGK